MYTPSMEAGGTWARLRSQEVALVLGNHSVYMGCSGTTAAYIDGKCYQPLRICHLEAAERNVKQELADIRRKGQCTPRLG